ncbi:glycosyltransferase family 4 protein [Rhodanobacter sp. DHG33]|uniref:glycosyltransferase family 4 protein n=1 Tax=Rhodanobacter sp. DHG33 TaxID=2775921 RepID=UPI0017807B70|nr:glycosyltransferase family 4 protein [Rhodanobacter sp. DHG33]MBD8898689.1 glycosyltransferase family 4 protein [Rhodanobacter sp. DHG33]
MTSQRHGSVRVLMLGWEYPPRYVGGLGKASQGIARGLADLGADVLFVLPRFRKAQGETRLQVSGAREWLLEHGATPRGERVPRWLGVTSRLQPYARPSERTARDVDAYGSGDAAALYGSDLGHEVASFAARVAAIADDAQADVVHAHDWMTFPAAMAAADRHGLPLFLHVHSTEYDRSGDGANPDIAAIERIACERADHVFAVSDYTRGLLLARYGIDPAKVSVVYNAPDEDALPPAPPSGSEIRQPWVVFLGRLTFQKGPDHFLRAAAEVARLDPAARYLICGTGDMLDALKRQAGELGIADRVEFRGFLAPGAVDRLLARSSLLVMPSVSEPFGLVALEALCAGTPVILSRQSGVREVLGHSLQVDFWDHEKLADQILAVLRLPVLARQLVEEGQAQLARLSWDESAQRIAEAYAHVAGVDLATLAGGGL